VCPLSRPINLDEVGAPSQICPPASFFHPLLLLGLPLFPRPLFLSPPTFSRWKTLVVIVAAGSLLVVYAADWRNIYTTEHGDDSVQFAGLWRKSTFPLPPPPPIVKLLKSQTRCIHTHTHVYLNTCTHCCGYRRSWCSCLPAAVCELWGRVFGRGLL